MAAPARFPCPSCSAGMAYDPVSGKLKCPYCSTLVPVPEDAKASVRELPYDEYRSIQLQTLSDKALQVTCTSCGSTVEFEPPEVAGTCPFCAAALVAQAKAADPMVAPHGVLPFHVTSDQAQVAVKNWLGGLWFAPNGLKNIARADGLNGVYLPFWTFDAQTTTDYQGQRGEHYYVTESYTTQENGRTVQRTRQVMRTRWYPASGTVHCAFDDVLVPATKSVNADKLGGLDPWGPEPVRPYEPAYLAGFKAQRYQIDLPQGYTEAQRMMQGDIHAACRRDIGGDEQQVHHTDTSYRNVTFKHILLPVWIGAYRFNAKVYQVLVNARTAEVQGERPYSAVKIAVAVIIALIVLAIVAMLRN